MILYLLCFKKERPKWLIIFLVIMIAFFAITSITVIYDYLINNIQIFRKYHIYGKEIGSFGIKQFIDYLPIVVCLYFDIREKKKNKITNISLMLCIVGIVVGIAGYSIENLSRLYTYFMYLFIVYVPMLIKDKTEYKYFNKERGAGWVPFTLNSIKLFYLVYLLYRGIGFLAQVWESSGFSSFNF